MAELGEGLSGYLDVQDATLRAPRIEAVSNLAVGNTAPQHAFSVGSNLYVSTDSSNVLTVDGNVVCEGVKVGLIEIVPSYDFAAVSNVGNVTQSTIQFSNATTGFVTTANIEVGTANLFVDTTTGRVGIGKTDPGAALDVVGDVEISGETVLGTATYRKRRDWDRNALAYVYLGNVTTNNTTGIRLDVSLNNSTTGYQMFNFQITLQGNDASHAGGKLVYSVQGTRNDNISRDVHIGYVYVGIPGSFEYQLWLKDPTTDTTGDMDAYLNCQGYYNFDTGVSDVAQGGAAPTNFQDGTVGVLVDSTGNVGIGTTTPTGQLEVHGFGQTSFTSFNQAGNMGATLALRDDDGVAGSGGGIMFGADQGFFAAIRGTLTDGADNTSGELRFYTRNPPSSSTMQCNMTMDRSGSVGIGTTTPVGLLDVFGGSASSDSLMYVRNTANANTDRGAGIVFENRADNGTRFSLGHILALRENSVGSYSSYLRFSPTVNGSPFEAMRIHASGKVGIGVTDPIARLHDPGDLAVGNVNGDNYSSEQKAIYLMRGFQRTTGLSDRHHYISTKTLNTTGGNQIIFYLDDGSTDNGTAHVATMKLDGTGHVTVAGSVYASSQTLSSDDRIKYNEQNISDALTIISHLKPQKYEKLSLMTGIGTWIPTDEEWENVKGDYKHGDEFGFIAQDIKKIPELSFLVHGEETRTDTKTSAPEEYSNLTTEEQVTYTTSYVYESNTITQEEYSNLTPEEQGLYSTQYTKQIETQTPLALNYQGLFVVAIGAIQELKAKNDTLEAQVANLLERVTALESI